MQGTSASETDANVDIVAVDNLVKRYGNLVALDHFDLHIGQGEVFGLLGPNGSGKTTAINCILQLLTYDKGDHPRCSASPWPPRATTSSGASAWCRRTWRCSKSSPCARTSTTSARSTWTTARAAAQLVEEAMAFVGLEDYVKFRPRKLSGGLLRRLNIACGIAHKPELVFFDEPTVAVDPQSRNAILEGIEQP